MPREPLVVLHTALCDIIPGTFIYLYKYFNKIILQIKFNIMNNIKYIINI